MIYIVAVFALLLVQQAAAEQKKWSMYVEGDLLCNGQPVENAVS